MGGAPTVNQPQTNYTKELTQTLAGYQQTAPGFLALSQQYSPGYTDLNLQTLQQTLFGDQNAPGQLGLQQAAATSNRGADIADINRYGLAGYQALLRSNPGLAQSLGNANAQGAGVFAPGSLMSQLQNTTQGQLALGGALSPQEQTAADQASRAGFASRGMLYGNQSFASDILNRDAQMQQRLGQRIGYANSVEQLAGQNRNYLSGLAQMNAGIYDPSQQVIARSGTTLGGLSGGGVGATTGALLGTNNTNNLFNPNAGNDAYNTNLNAQGAANIANANNSAARSSSYIAGGAALAGAAIVAI